MILCKRCNGLGEYVDWSGGKTIMVDCVDCKGTGEKPGVSIEKPVLKKKPKGVKNESKD